MRRGEIWWADLGEPVGSGPRHPVVVSSTDTFNESRISTVIVTMITSNLRLAVAPGNVRVAARESGLRKESVVNVSQVLTVDKGVLIERIGHLTGDRLGEVEAGLRDVMGCRPRRVGNFGAAGFCFMRAWTSSSVRRTTPAEPGISDGKEPVEPHGIRHTGRGGPRRHAGTQVPPPVSQPTSRPSG